MNLNPEWDVVSFLETDFTDKTIDYISARASLGFGVLVWQNKQFQYDIFHYFFYVSNHLIEKLTVRVICSRTWQGKGRKTSL